MARAVRFEGVYLRVNVAQPRFDRSRSAWVRLGDTVKESIKRHIDDTDGIAVEIEETGVCEHCGAPWTEDSPVYNGGCCKGDIDPNEEPR